MTIDEAFEMITKAIRDGRSAHGYLIVGGVRGMARELSERVLRFLYPEGDLRSHPDIHRLAPEMRSRVISVEAMRERLIEPLASTSFEGGWKTGVLYGADRLRQEAANAFLKTLEEPTARTLFLLLTEQPEQILPTIISRCQRVDLPDARGRTLEEPYRSRVIAELAADRLTGAVARAAAAARLVLILDELKKKAENEVLAEVGEADEGPGEETGKDARLALISSRYREYRTDFCATVMGWFRDVMALVAAPPSHSAYGDAEVPVPLVNESSRSVLESCAARTTMANAMYNVNAVEEMYKSLDRNMQEAEVLSFAIDRLR